MDRGDLATRSSQLLRLARRVTARHDLDDVLAEVFRSLRPLVEFGGGSIQLLDDEGWIRMAASDPAAPAHVLAQRVPLGTSVAGRVILTEQPAYLADIEPDYGETDDSSGKHAVSTGVRCYFAVPLVADGHAIGVLQLDSPEVDAWTEEERLLFVSVAPVVAAAIQNARAHARSMTARVRTETVEARLAEARSALVAVCDAAADVNSLDLHRALDRLDTTLNGATEVCVVELPRQRRTMLEGTQSTG